MQPVICEIIITFSAETKKTKRKLIVPLLIFLFPVRISPEGWFLFCCKSHSFYILYEASLTLHICCILLMPEQSFSSLLFFYLFFLWKIYSLDKLTYSHTSLNLLKTSWIAAILGSSSVLWQLHSPLFRFIPHTLQIPLQSSLHRTFIGQFTKISP